MEAFDKDSLPSTVALGTYQKQPTSSSGQLNILDNELYAKTDKKRRNNSKLEAQKYASEYKIRSHRKGNPQDELSNQFESSDSKDKRKNRSKENSQIGEGLAPSGLAIVPKSTTNKNPP